MEESVLGFLYAFLPALTELVIGIRRPKCGLSTLSAPCLGFFCAKLKGEKMIGALWKYIWEHKWLYLSIAVVLVIYDYTILIPTQVIQRLVDQLSKQTLTQSSFARDIGLLLGATFFNYISAYYWHLKLFQASVHYKAKIQGQAFRKLVAMRRPFYEKFRSGDLLTRFTTDVDGMMGMVGYGMLIVLYGGGLFLFIIPAMFLISWQLSLISFIPMSFLVLSTYLLVKKEEIYVDENRDAVAHLNDEVLESIEGIRVMRAYSRKERQVRQFQERTESLAKTGDKIASIQNAFGPFALFFIGVSTVLLLVCGGHFLKTGQISLGQLLGLELYLVALIEPMWMLADFILVYQTAKTSHKKLSELDEEDDDLEPEGEEWLEELDEVVFENYSFTYPMAEKESLSQISFQFNKGQTIGIVGRTGAGKTSLVRQFLRQYPLGQGTFTINGQPVARYVRRSIEEKIGYVSQEHILFSKSILENISLGKKGASQEDIMDAIAQAAFTDDLERMSDGLDTMIGEKGVSVSGGQKQRISLARAFLRDAQLLLLDDSLSAVDAKTEQAIIATIQKERQGKTTLIVSHRLSAVHQADWILVLDQGRIVEEGRASDLLAQEGWYYEQYQRQQRQEGE